MSSTGSSRRSSSGVARRDVVRRLVRERADREWCLFLDRDGVINRQIVGDYVRRWPDFEWLPMARAALIRLRGWAPYLVVVTNQQGIGKGLMDVSDVDAIHHNVRTELASDGVLIDRFQVCPHLETADCACRKPKPGLVLDWLEKHPSVDCSLSVMVGDSDSDLELAHQVALETGGCASVRIGGRGDNGFVADASFDSLWEFAMVIDQLRD